MTNKNNKNAMKPFHGAEKISKHVQTVFGQSIKELMVTYFESLDSHLFDLAETAETHTQQKHFFDSLKSIRVHKFNVLTSFLTSLKQTFKLFEEGRFDYFESKVTEAIKRNSSITASIDKNDIEEKLLQNTLIQKADETYLKDLAAFRNRFSILIANPIEAHHIPICPYVLVSSFAKSIRLLHLDLDVKLVLYSLFERLLLEKMGVIYQEINQYLHNNGIEPGIENILLTKKINKTKTQYKNPEDEVLQAAIKKRSKDDLPDLTIDKESMFDVLKNLQVQVIKDLSNTRPVDISPIDIKNTLLIQLQQPKYKDNNQTISQPSKDAVNLITMMFQLISGDRNIPRTIKRLLSKLHIPYIKAAMDDKSILTNKLHPAQVILSLISKALVGWTPEKDIDDIFFNKVNTAVENILATDNRDELFFNKQLEEYQGFIKEQKNEFKQEQTRVEEKLKGRDRIVTAMKTIEALINHKIQKVKMPVLIDKVLMGSWKNLLVLLLVRHSDTSDEYLYKVNFIDNLINVVESEQHEVILKPRINKLCDEYGDGLTLVAYSGEGLKNKIQEFKQCLFDLHKLEDIEEVDNVAESAPEILNVAEDDFLPEFAPKPKNEKSKAQPVVKEETKEQPAANKKTKKTMEPLTVEVELSDQEILDKALLGSWFEFQRNNKKAVKAQLSWISPKTGMHLFVNSRGLKVVDKMKGELVSGYKDRTIIFLKKA